MVRLGLPLIAFVLGPVMGKSQVQIQGHRGCRGHFPENTIPGFLHALELGVDVLEMDVVITGDGHVLVSHEPWMNPDICLNPQGQSLRGRPKVNLYRLTLAEIQTYDCGALGHPRFPDQQPVFVHKPALSQVFQAIRQWEEEHPERTCQFNIEIKRERRQDHLFHPIVQEYCDRVVLEIENSGMKARCMIQSFDPETLEYLHRTNPELPLAFLVERGSFRRNMKKLSFTPQVYSPNFTLLSPEEVQVIHRHHVKVIPWTVNEPEDLTRMIKWGVDGIISDYPDRITPLQD